MKLKRDDNCDYFAFAFGELNAQGMKLNDKPFIDKDKKEKNNLGFLDSFQMC